MTIQNCHILLIIWGIYTHFMTYKLTFLWEKEKYDNDGFPQLSMAGRDLFMVTDLS